jgi:beta-lactamase class A
MAAGALLLIMSLQSQLVALPAAENHPGLSNYTLDFTNHSDPDLQAGLETIEARLREKYAMTATQSAVGIFDLKRLRLAMIRPDRIEYAASVPKIGILLAWFEVHPESATSLDRTNRHELGLMIKASSNEMAAKYSRELGLKRIQQALDHYHFYDTNHGGGIWVGKHYGQGGERIGDPIADHSHAATVRQLLRFYLLLQQERLISVEASRRMLEIFASPEIPHEENKFVKGLSGRGLTILRKSGSWEDWLHDTGVVSGPDRRYILVALTHHPKGDDYLAELARSVDDLMKE